MGGFLIRNARWLGAGALLTLSSSYGQTFFISIFAGEIRAEFGLSHAAWGGIYTAGTTISALVMIWAGALTDRFRVRVLGPAVLLMLACACIAMATVQAAWLLPVIIFALRFTGQGMTSHIAMVAMARWFVATRGKALSVATLGYATGESVLPIIFVALLASWHWQSLWVVAALMALAVIPLLMWLLTQERTPQTHAKENQAAGMGGAHWNRRQTLRHYLFWFMVPALLGPAAFNTAFFFQQVHFAEIKQISHLQLVALFPVYTGVGIGAMLASGWALDRWGTARVMPLYQLPMVAAFLCFAAGQGLFWIILGFVFLALTSGANSTLPNAFWAEFYGTRHIGAVKAMAAAVMVFGSAIGPGVTGALIDAGVGIEAQYIGVAGYFLLATAAMAIGIRRAAPLLLSRAAEIDVIRP